MSEAPRQSVGYRLGRFIRTVRHLRAGQIGWRLWYRVYRAKPDTRPAPPIRSLKAALTTPVSRPASLVGPASFVFLNETRTIRVAEDWNDPRAPKLWLYNLHYFDDLNAHDADEKVSWHQEVITRWVDENPPATGNGWEPYPTSLRIVNWVKWALAGNEFDQTALHSLAVQARWLRRHLEYHLLGNHLLANAKALVFVGTFFEGPEADSWRDKGVRILDRQLGEQILNDGPHFELSPMYHLLTLEDGLDLINLQQAYAGHAPKSWLKAARSMLAWSACMRHPDGGLPFFNDCAFNVAASPQELDRYANRLGVDAPTDPEAARGMAAASEYIRLDRGPATLFFDVAPLGPDYLPAHAHADSLAFELSIGERRVVVNSGTSTYEPVPLREWQRSTAAHNTVVLDDCDSSEVWAAFRVGRRAKVSTEAVETQSDVAEVSARHDGYAYLHGRPFHRRWLRLDGQSLDVADEITGSGSHRFASYLHFHPDVEVRVEDAGRAVLYDSETAKRLATLTYSGDVTLHTASGHWYPRFGVSVPNTCCVLAGESELPAAFGYGIDWASTK